MLHSSDKSPLTISQLTFGLRGITILREKPEGGYQAVAGPYYADELDLLRNTLANFRGRPGIAIAEEKGGVTIFREI